MTTRNSSENAELPLVPVAFEPDDAARTVRAAWRLRLERGMAGSGLENGRCYSRGPRRPGRPAAASPQRRGRSLELGTGGDLAEVGEGPRRGHPAPGRALEEPLLEEVGLVGLLDGVRLLPHALGE